MTTATVNNKGWRAQITDNHGRVLGSGFLIDPHRVMTCAHVVGKNTDLVVIFSEMPQLDSYRAKVEFRGPWTVDDERGDIAVLSLSSATSIPPARFARLNELAERRLDPSRSELHVYGFPRGYDREGADTQVRAPYESLHLGEWSQLEAITDRGIRLQAGFSGAAVSFADTGEVVGLVVGADRDKETRTGKMLPLSGIRRHWAPLINLLPIGRLLPLAWNALQELLTKASLSSADLTRIYLASLQDGLGPEPPQFTSTWELARFLADEVISESDAPLARFCIQVADAIDDDELRTELVRWREKNLSWSTANYTASSSLNHSNLNQEPGRVTIGLRPSGNPNEFLLAVTSTTSKTAHSVFQGIVTARQVRRTVERVLPEAISRVPAALDVMIEFELPLSWLNKPVHEWHADQIEKLPIGWAYPVVVRIPPSPTGTDRLRRLDRRWKKLLLQPKLTPLDSVDCRDQRDRNRLTAWLLADAELTVLALANPPKQTAQDPALRAALSAGVPAMVWAQQNCVDDHIDKRACRGDRFLHAITEALSNSSPTELPDRVRILRAEAAAKPDESNDEYTSIILYWDKPYIFDHHLPLGVAR
ncbi:trypsin-like peptidase domain-containing protein [Actinosynnema sp. CA-299493]